jgi:two-component system, NarL family, nitrate/nitrite response regulator NarL
MPIGVVLADDHPIVLAGLETVLHEAKDIKLLARCRDGEESLRAVRQHRPDVLVLDIRMPGKNGLEVLQELKREKLATRVVLLTAALDDNEVLEAVRLGVRGVILKEMTPDLLLQCIRKVHAGEQWLEKRSFQSALEKMLRREAAAKTVSGLTPRELEIVRMVAAGLRNKEIAAKLTITEGTVKIHLHSVYQKLELDGRMALSLYAQDKGLLSASTRAAPGRA